MKMEDEGRPQYKFEWDDGTVRRTKNLENKDDATPMMIETLAELGRQDERCIVTLSGWEM